MAAISDATPLIALDAVVVDTETPSLDPAKARIVEIAAVRLTGGESKSTTLSARSGRKGIRSALEPMSRAQACWFRCGDRRAPNTGRIR
jgi:DNA polymerase III epsilon subunit-like protein